MALPTLPNLWLHSAIKKNVYHLETIYISEYYTTLNTLTQNNKKKGFKIFFFPTWQTGWKKCKFKLFRSLIELQIILFPFLNFNENRFLMLIFNMQKDI